MSDVSPLRPEDPRRLGDYRLTGRLGVGGQGTVFLGTGAGVGASRGPVAVKLLHTRLDDATATAGDPVGTPAYIAPEQLEGRPAGPAADV